MGFLFASFIQGVLPLYMLGFFYTSFRTYRVFPMHHLYGICFTIHTGCTSRIHHLYIIYKEYASLVQDVLHNLVHHHLYIQCSPYTSFIQDVLLVYIIYTSFIHTGLPLYINNTGCASFIHHSYIQCFPYAWGVLDLSFIPTVFPLYITNT